MFWVLPRKSVLCGKEMDFATPHMQRRTAWKHVATVDEVQPKTFIHSFIHSFSKIKFDFYYDGLSCHVTVSCYDISCHVTWGHFMSCYTCLVLSCYVMSSFKSCHVTSIHVNNQYYLCDGAFCVDHLCWYSSHCPREIESSKTRSQDFSKLRTDKNGYLIPLLSQLE